MNKGVLKIRELGREFDLIESGGVLHHLAKPLEGWRALTDCLKPSGLMKISLYSEIARERIVRLRELIKERGLDSSLSTMKSFREELIREINTKGENMNWRDFFSMSEFRDLLFHVQEHRFTIPLIKSALKQLELQFAGFVVPYQVSKQFGELYKDTGDLYDLEKWDQFEQKHPETFRAMYGFYCQKTNENNVAG